MQSLTVSTQGSNAGRLANRRTLHAAPHFWQARWGEEDFSAPWLNRGVSAEIAESVASGWFPAGASALDIGCGEGQVAAWMAEHGFPTVGFDIAPAAIARARSQSFDCMGRLEFYAVDACHQPPPDRRHQVLIDRGCFHSIAPQDHAAFVENLVKVSDPNARMLLYIRAYRDGVPMGDVNERRRITAMVVQGFGKYFRAVRAHDTYLDPFGGSKPEKAMGGIVYWMERRQG